MYNIIKNKSIILNKWILFIKKHKKFLLDIFKINKNIFIKYELLKKKKKILKNKKISIYFKYNKNILNILKLNKFNINLILLNINIFKNGNFFSIINNIKNKLKFKKKIIIKGFFLKDQIFYMNKIGINTFFISNKNNIYNYIQQNNDDLKK